MPPKTLLLRVGWAACILCLLFMPNALVLSVTNSTQSSSQRYWNTDGDFSLASQKPYYAHGTNIQIHNSPWGSESWNTAAFATNGTRPSPVDEYKINVTTGVAHAWVHEDRRLVNARTGIVGFGEDPTGGYQPPWITTLGRDTILAYRIMRENTSISDSLQSPDSDGILFDLFAQSQYTVNGSPFTSFFVIDFYVHQECGTLNGLCAYTNDTTLTNGIANNHRIVGHTHFFEWRIHNNLDEKFWVSDVVNLSWYLEESQRMAYCHDTTGSDNCTSTLPQAYLTGLTATAETFGGSSGFALKYEYLLQTNDCGTGQDAGNDLNHPLRINNLSTYRFEEFNGWLGAGSLYQDNDDYYQFNVSTKWLGVKDYLVVRFEGADSISLYAPGNPPILESLSSNSSLGLWHNFTGADPPGFWYFDVHRSSGFGFYAFDVWLSTPSSRGAYGPLGPETCSVVSQISQIVTPWQFILGAGLVAMSIVAGGRYGSRRWQPHY